MILKFFIERPILANVLAVITIIIGLVSYYELPVEQAVNGVEHSIYMSSTSSSDGSYTLTVTFDVGTDLDKSLAPRSPFCPCFLCCHAVGERVVGKEKTG